MSIVAGCDVGSLTSKAVVMKNGRIAGSAIIKSKPRPDESADAVMHQVLSPLGLLQADVAYCMGTGYGRDSISFVNETRSEIACHGKGARWMVRSAKTVIDIGGQDCKVIRLDADGKIVKFIANDKCASGTGRFLEVMAKVLNIELHDLGALSKKSLSPIGFASTCTVWAQADVIKYINAGRAIEDIGAGINTAMANRVAMLASSVKVEDDVCMTGGVAKNTGVVSALERLLGHRIKRIRKADPQLVGAIGAALFSQERLEAQT